MTVLVKGNEIVLAGTVGALFWDDSFDATDVILALAQVGSGQDVTIRLNSGGGIATEGAAIHAALRAHQGRKTVIVEGIAASAASLTRIAAIMDSDEAKGREAQAKHLAFSTDMAPDAAKAILAAGPKAEPEKPGKSQFEQRMDATRNPQIGPEGGDNADDPEVVGAGIVALYRGGQKRSA